MFGGGLSVNFDGLRIVLALALLGAVLGFVPYNFNPASIFMGDTGSMLLGFACAVMIILMGQGQHPKWFLASMVMFALPVLDTALAFARRYVAAELMVPDAIVEVDAIPVLGSGKTDYPGVAQLVMARLSA